MEDISIWQKPGHFYFALTERTPARPKKRAASTSAQTKVLQRTLRSVFFGTQGTLPILNRVTIALPRDPYAAPHRPVLFRMRAPLVYLEFRRGAHLDRV